MPPAIAISSPAGPFVNDPTPQIVVDYADPQGSGIFLASLAVALDGTDLKPFCSVTAMRATCVAPALSEGSHRVEAGVQDRAGNSSSASRDFTVDATAPTILAQGPLIFADGFESGDVSRWGVSLPAALITNDPTPSLLVVYSDLRSGIDPATFGVAVGATEATAGCQIGPDSALCELPALPEGEHEVTVDVADRAGNPAQATLAVTVDLTPPVITAAADPPANAASWNNSAVTVTFDCQDAFTGVRSCPAPVIVAGAGAGQVVRGTAFDQAGNFASAEVTQSIDLTPPAFDPAELRPLPCPAVTTDLRAPVRACSTDDLSGPVNATLHLLVDGVDRTAEAAVTFGCITWAPPADFALGEHQAMATVADAAGNAGEVDWCFEVTLGTLDVAIVSPPNGFLTREATVDVSGTVDALADSVTVNGVAATLNGGTFEALAVPLVEGQNVIEAVAANSNGGEGSASVMVTRDSTPPTITAMVDPPANGAGWQRTAVTVTFDCTDDGSGVATCTDPVTVSAEGAGQEVVGTAVDVAGNSAETTVTLNLDLTPPTISVTAAPPANPAGWNNTPVMVIFDCDDALSGLALCSGSRTVSAEGADQVVAGTAIDVAGNSATADVLVSIDLSPPTFDPAEVRPRPCPEVTREARPQVRACFADAFSGVDEATVTLTVDGVDRRGLAVIADGCVSWDPQVGFGPGEHQAESTAADLASNGGSVSWCFEVVLPPVAIAIDSPVPNFLTRDDTVDVSGTVEDGVESVTVNGVAADVAGTAFTALAVPIHEGRNVVTAVARTALGNSGLANVAVLRDTTAPSLSIETPRPGAMLTSLQVDVAGLVNDIIAGTTINADDCSVTVNGVEAAVANRSFVVPDLLLKRGLNTLVAVATDRLGNSSTTSIEVMVEDRAGQRIVLLAGNNQSSGIFEELSDPLVVALEDANGDPVIGRPVRFEVSRGAGTLRAFPEQGGEITVLSDELGHASVLYTLGGRSGAGNNRVLATAPGFLGEVEFCAGATPDVPVRVATTDGDQQSGAAEATLPQPLIVLVTDAAGNSVGGVDVTFEVLQGGGSFGGSPTVVITTNLDGLAQTLWTLGPEAGINNNVARATFPGLVEAGATFTASAQHLGQPSETRVSGVVLDNQDNPVPGVTLKIDGTGLSAVADDQGQFSIAGAPVGFIHLSVDSTTATRPGNWSSLAFEMTTTAGRDNTIGRPVYILPIDVTNSAPAASSVDVTLTLANVPGAELTVFANSVTCPDGTKNCEVSVTQVRSERVPMEPPLGSLFMLAWTIQPAGATFDPPARICIPASGMQPGQQAEIFSFDHGQGEFIAVGSGTVGEDGTQLCSDPGFGVVEGGWHGCVPPPPPCTPGGAGSCDDNDNNVCTEKRRVPQECGFTCEPVNTDGRNCDDKDKCTVMDTCMGNRCEGEEIEVTITDAPVAICVGTTKTATATITPAGRSISWMSGDTSKLTVSGSGTTATLTGVSTGSFFRTVKVTAKDAASGCSSDSRSVEVIERDDFTGLFAGTGEKTWCATNAMNPIILAGCARAYQVSQQVLDWEATTFPGRCRGEGSPGDAARHARWSCELHSDPLTSLIADELLRRHENQRDDPCESHEQDLNNNEQGKRNSDAGRDCAASALADLGAGRLQVNNPAASCP